MDLKKIEVLIFYRFSWAAAATVFPSYSVCVLAVVDENKRACSYGFISTVSVSIASNRSGSKGSVARTNNLTEPPTSFVFTCNGKSPATQFLCNNWLISKTTLPKKTSLALSSSVGTALLAASLLFPQPNQEDFGLSLPPLTSRGSKKTLTCTFLLSKRRRTELACFDPFGGRGTNLDSGKR